jgi:hypothetical protein
MRRGGGGQCNREGEQRGEEVDQSRSQHGASPLSRVSSEAFAARSVSMRRMTASAHWTKPAQ